MAQTLVSEFGRWTFPAGSTSLVQYQFVTINASGQIVTPASSAVPCLILDDAPQLGAGGVQGPTVVGVYYGCVFTGIMKVIAGAAITPGQQIASDTSGHAIVASGANAVQGYSFTAASTGDLVAMYVAFAGIF
jgi:hypothetical protein